MAEKTSIEWTDATWNPLVGCSKVSEGCRHCYAMVMASRIANAAQRALRDGKTLTGRQEAYRQVVRWRDGGMDPASTSDVALREWNGRVVLDPDALAVPLSWREPRRVFVNSMSDLFHDRVHDEWIDGVFAVMALAGHRFQVLTKRPERMQAYLSRVGVKRRLLAACLPIVGKSSYTEELHAAMAWPLPNVWLGVSVEDQATADERIPFLLETPAAVRFVSHEPALGPVSFRNDWLPLICDDWPSSPPGTHPCAACGDPFKNAIRWIIVGGESGNHARPFDVAWARSTIEQCRAAGVACFVKQLGALAFEGDGKHRHLSGFRDGVAGLVVCDEGHPCGVAGGRCPQWYGLKLRDRKGGDMAEWPEDLRVREFPEVRR